MLSVVTSRHLQAAFLLAGATGFVQLILGTLWSALVAAVAAWSLYVAALVLHEAGHFTVARGYGAGPRYLGSSVASMPATRAQAVAISVAGPLAGSVVPLLLLSGHSLPGLKLASATLAVNHLAMLLPVFADGRVIFLTSKDSRNV